MRANLVAVVVAGAAMALSVLPGTGVAGPPPREMKLPGRRIGTAEARWLAPYVLFTRRRVGEARVKSIRWFDANGNVTRELAGPRVDACVGFVSDYGTAEPTFYGLQSDWKLSFRRKGLESGYNAAAGDTFIYQFLPQRGQIAVDIYTAGKLVGTVGPYLQYEGRDFSLADDGSVTLLTWKSADRKAVQIVAASADGKLRLTVDCGENVWPTALAPDGRGVLVREVMGRELPDRTVFYDAAGKRRVLDVGGSFRRWVSPPATALFETGPGTREQHTLVDCTTGKTMWDVPGPVTPYPTWATLAYPLGDVILFIGKDFAAVDAKTGRVVSRWVPNKERSSFGWLCKRGEQLFFVTDDEFTELSLADIAAERNGWKAPEAGNAP